ncbi:Secreted protein containing C-terminal beta-propeller domain [Paenibacillus tianmuensis]|uniref:Secreted protein containing C-terminal beta-propeller domain n=1 Tax=Paenibacillus tianmuensis TaxID=624147 RepID=A0A1G4RR42_9BACL|nr:beta-propeller domain-containing protein [Paenibacillus tianmuensis]SCW59403.1 Secreted protein containing C-terminal beta-propeller domain [Paenibacillus tianmuensis]
MQKRTLFAGLLALTLLTSVSPAPVSLGADAGPTIALTLNGQPVSLSVQPRLIGNTLMVPLRELSEALGVKVQWDEAERSAAATKAERSIKLRLDSKEAFRGSEAVALDEAPALDNGNIMVPLRFFSESFDFNVYWDGANKRVTIVDADKSLPTVGSRERMEALLKESASVHGNGSGINLGSDNAIAVTEKSFAAAPQAAGSAAKQSSDAAPSYSGTNVQVQGVDEADVIKTDGTYIYQVNRDRVLVTKAYPSENMSVVSTVYWADPNFYPQELYVDNNYLVVVGNTSYPTYEKPGPIPYEASPSVSAEPGIGEAKKMVIWPGRPTRSTTKTIVYGLGDRTQLKQVREAELEGHYVSSRKIGDSLYVVTNKSMNYFWIMRQEADSASKQANESLPAYRDSAAGAQFITIGYEDIRYFPKAVEPNYLLIGGLKLSKPDQKMQVTSYLGSGQNVYASPDNLYVTVSEYEPVKENEQTVQTDGKTIVRPASLDMTSAIYKFGMDNGTVRYVGRGKVPGHALNQFSMDEHNGYFRIATTSGDMWRNDEHTSKNNVYVLNESLSVVGKLEGLAPGERIYSVRYAGNRAYMVTFKNTDPLFVLDLSKPQAPAMLGKLKIPGYSDYLHPYDENHLIGFGKEAVEVANKKGDGSDTVAFYQGMKLALFDVSDVANPKELFKETIGDRGTESPLLHNHKALLFSKEKQLLAFPVTVAELKDKTGANTPENASKYGDFTFQGAYVYRLDLQKGFQLRGKITHLTGEDMNKAGQHWYGSERNIERLLYIGDTLYSSSPDMLKANDLNTLREVGSLQLPTWKPRNP